MDCKHDKVYSDYKLTSLPEKRAWICRKCGAEGYGVNERLEESVYRALKDRFRKTV